MLHHLLFLFLLVLFSCSAPETVPTPAEENLFAERPPESISGDGSPVFLEAQEFDRFLRGRLSNEEASHLTSECKQKPAQNPFCSGVLQKKALLALAAEKSKIYSPPAAKLIYPVGPKIVNGKVANWGELRKTPVENLLKGFLAVPFAELIVMAKELSKNKHCPNFAAVAIAATLEDYLPESVPLELLSDLYAQGGRCARSHPVDREHYLTRAGLFAIWAKKYDKAESLLKKVEPIDAFSGRALYWLAYAQGAQGLKDKANATIHHLIQRHPLSFHALLAAKESQQDFPADWVVDRPEGATRSQSAVGANPFIGEAEVLKRYGFDYSAALVSEWALEHFSHLEGEVRIHLSSLADPPTAVAEIPFVILAHPKLANRQVMQAMYPKPFYESFVRNSQNLSPYLLLSIARKESRFNPKAVSIANAQGLMQINPDTALKLTSGKQVNLLDPNTSIELAARHLSAHLNTFNQNLPQAIAAYNAGEDAVKSWARRYTVSPPALFIDLMPYRETRDYVGFVLSYYYWYKRLYDQNPEEVIP